MTYTDISTGLYASVGKYSYYQVRLGAWYTSAISAPGYSIVTSRVGNINVAVETPDPVETIRTGSAWYGYPLGGYAVSTRVSVVGRGQSATVNVYLSVNGVGVLISVIRAARQLSQAWGITPWIIVEQFAGLRSHKSKEKEEQNEGPFHSPFRHC
jgi:hypothetical protein